MKNKKSSSPNDNASAAHTFRDLVHQFGNPRVIVLGDVFLERITYGIRRWDSAEAPVLWLRAKGQEDIELGGAASCAAFIAALGAKVELASAVADDPDGRVLRALLKENAIQDAGLITNCEQPTSVRHTLVNRSCGQQPQLLRLDHETQSWLPEKLQDELRSYLSVRIPQCNAVVICDRRRSICEAHLISEAIAMAVAANVPVLVEPPRMRNYGRFAGATLLRLNRSKLELATATRLFKTSDAVAASHKLGERCKVPLVVVTLGRDGMIITETDRKTLGQYVAPREVSDPTGAGYAILATFAMCLAAGISHFEAGGLASIAASLEHLKRGPKPITRQELLDAAPGAPDVRSLQQSKSSKRSYDAGNCKIVSLNKLLTCLAPHRARGEHIVLTTGEFQIFHRGHLACLEEAATFGDVLVVAVAGDQLVRRESVPGWPLMPQEDRAAMLAALECVDYILIHNSDSTEELVRLILPNTLANGDDRWLDDIPGKDFVEACGGNVRLIKWFEGHSTLQLLSRAGRMLELLRSQVQNADDLSTNSMANPTAQNSRRKRTR
jgi:D-beta-D-heptose 7-phosphate kinase/D-beta-D-heptose 1-phosphate adenosyltransferase